MTDESRETQQTSITQLEHELLGVERALDDEPILITSAHGLRINPELIELAAAESRLVAKITEASPQVT